MKYVIVKHAAEVAWSFYFTENPKLGVDSSYSAHDTYTGKQCGILPIYEDADEAYKDCEEMNKANPSGWYEVCIAIEA